MLLTINSSFDAYQIIEFKGAGAFGEVYKVRQTLTQEVQALKLLPGAAASPEMLERARRELLSLRRIQSPYVVKPIDLRQTAEGYFLTMEFVDGEDLEKLVFVDSPLLAPKHLILVFKRVALALRTAHKCHVFHRDIKPANIILESYGRPRIVDFGIASLVDLPRITSGSLGYNLHLAPEYVQSGTITPQVDIYAMGVTMYRCLARTMPKQADGSVYWHGNPNQNAPVPPSAGRPNVPPWLDGVVMKCLAKDPGKRYRTMHEVLLDINKHLGIGKRGRAVVAPVVAREVPVVRYPFKGKRYEGKIDSDNGLAVDLVVANPFTGRRANVKALLDTGATVSMISRQVAESIGLGLRGERLIRTVSGEQMVMGLAEVSVQIPGLPSVVACNVHVSYGRPDLPNILGTNGLQHLVVVIDGRKGTFFITEADERLP